MQARNDWTREVRFMRSLVKIPKELSAGTFLCHLAYLFAVTIDAPQIHKITQVS